MKQTFVGGRIGHRLRWGTLRCVAVLALAGLSFACSSRDAGVVEPVARTSAALTLSQQPSQITGLDGDWYTADITPMSGYVGSATYTAPTFELRSKGLGAALIQQDAGLAPDGMQFVYTQRTGDFEIVVRVVSASDSGYVDAGIMARAGLDPRDLMGAAWFAPDFNPSDNKCTYSPTTGISSIGASSRILLSNGTHQSGPNGGVGP